MKSGTVLLLVVTALAGFALPWPLPAQTTVSATAAAAAPYRPSMSDMMNIGVQPRHIRLWLAARQWDWPYAAYELDELRGAFGRIGRTIPTYRTLDIPAILTAFTRQPLDALDAAIKNHDTDAFTVAYRQLTDNCNACHQSLQHSMVVVKIPDASAYPDQDFRANRTHASLHRQ